MFIAFRLIELLGTAFTLWMLVDCAQRGSSNTWFWVILWFPVIGPLAYFFTEKIHDWDIRWLKQLWNRPPSLDQLRYELKGNPCVANKVKLANALVEHKQFEEAIPLYNAVLKGDPDSKEARYGRGLSKLGLGDGAAAVADIERVLELDRTFRDYDPWLDLAAAHWQQGQKDTAVTLLQKLAQKSLRTKHMTVLAEYLLELDRRDEARDLLGRVMEDYQYAPTFVKRQDRRWAQKAKSLLKSASATPAP